MEVLKHIEWLKKKYWDEIKHKISLSPLDFDENTVDYVLSTLAAADPSKKKRAVDWMLKVWLKDGFLWEDVRSGERSKTYEALVMFAKYRGGMTRENRNLSNHVSLGSVWRAIEPFESNNAIDQISSRQVKKELKEKVLSETLILKHTEDQIAIVPLTVESSMWWGRGTRWCTSAREDNYFDSYNKKAPLIVLIFPKGLANEPDKGARKFQLWLSPAQRTDNIQFMDEADEKVSLSLITDNWSDFEPIIGWCMEKSIEAVKWLPKDKWTVEIRDRVVNERLHLANYIPLKLMDEEFCRLWIGKSRNFTSLIPQDKLSLSSRKLAVSLYPEFLSLLPNEEKTLEICLKALNISAISFHYVPEHFKTQYMCDLVMCNNPKLISLIPDRFITEKMCKDALAYNVNFLAKIPTRFITKEICTQVTLVNFGCIKYVPEHFLDEEMIIQSICSDSENDTLDWKIIPDHLLTENVLHAYMKTTRYELRNLLCKTNKINCFETIVPLVNTWGTNVLADIYTSLNDQKTAELLVKKYPLSINYLVNTNFDHLITMERCKKAVLNGLELIHIPETFRTKELCRIAIKAYMSNISGIPTSLGVDFLHELVDENPQILMHCYFAPRSLATSRFWMECVKKHSIAINLIPRDVLTPEIMCELLENDINSCMKISRNIQAEWMFLLAVEKQPDIINRLPDRWQTQAIQQQAIKGGFPAENIRYRINDLNLDRTQNAHGKNVNIAWTPCQLNSLKEKLLKDNCIGAIYE